MTDLPPGYELDVLIAEKIMGWRILSHWDCEGTIKHLVDENQCEVRPPEIKPYSTSIAAAWEVVEKLNKWKFTLTWQFFFGGGGSELKAYATAIFDPVLTSRREDLFVKAETAPHAICLAALKAQVG